MQIKVYTRKLDRGIRKFGMLECIPQALDEMRRSPKNQARLIYRKKNETTDGDWRQILRQNTISLSTEHMHSAELHK